MGRVEAVLEYYTSTLGLRGASKKRAEKNVRSTKGEEKERKDYGCRMSSKHSLSPLPEEESEVIIPALEYCTWVAGRLTRVECPAGEEGWGCWAGMDKPRDNG